MKRNLSRRDFHKLTGAALGGFAAGAFAGCRPEMPEPQAADDHDHDHAHDDHPHEHAPAAVAAGEPDPKLLTEAPNVCRGLNVCANHKGGDNACAGQGACYTANKHTCHGENECKGQGGCGGSYGQNACKGQGECGVPLLDKTWEKARVAFEKAMTEAGKKFGPAPDKS